MRRVGQYVTCKGTGAGLVSMSHVRGEGVELVSMSRVRGKGVELVSMSHVRVQEKGWSVCHM